MSGPAIFNPADHCPNANCSGQLAFIEKGRYMTCPKCRGEVLSCPFCGCANYFWAQFCRGCGGKLPDLDFETVFRPQDTACFGRTLNSFLEIEVNDGLEKNCKYRLEMVRGRILVFSGNRDKGFDKLFLVHPHNPSPPLLFHNELSMDNGEFYSGTATILGAHLFVPTSKRLFQIDLPAISTRSIFQPENTVKGFPIPAGPEEIMPLSSDLLLMKRQTGSDSLEFYLWKASTGEIQDHLKCDGRHGQAVLETENQRALICIFTDQEIETYLVNLSDGRFEQANSVSLGDRVLCGPPVYLKERFLLLARRRSEGHHGKQFIISWRSSGDGHLDSIPFPGRSASLRMMAWQGDILLCTHNGISLFEPIYLQIMNRWESIGMGLLTNLDADASGSLLSIPYQDANSRVSVAVLSKNNEMLTVRPSFHSIESSPRLWGENLYLLARKDASEPVTLFGYGIQS